MRRWNLTLLLSVMVLFCAAALPAEEPVTYIKAGKLLDVRSGNVLTNQVIEIRGERIERVGPAGAFTIPPGATVIDLGNATVLPGLIDMHDHITFTHKHHGYNGLGVSIPRQALYGAMNARITLNAGFTSIRNVGSGGYTGVALRDAINEGDIVGPRIRAAGSALGITGGHCDNNLLPKEYDAKGDGIADGPWAVRAKVREIIKYGADVIKFCATGGVLSKGDAVGVQQYTQEEMDALVAEAHQHDRRVAAHAHGAEGIKAAIRAGVDSVDHASLIDEEGIRLAKEHGTFLVMDIYNDTFILTEGAKFGMLPESIEKERQIGQKQRDNFRKAFEAGVRMAFGTDGAVYPHGDNAKQFAYMVEYGMTPMEAIQTATMHSAELLGWPEDVGAIEPGKFADIIAVNGNPLDDVTILEHIGFVMKGGKVFKNKLAH